MELGEKGCGGEQGSGDGLGEAGHEIRVAQDGGTRLERGSGLGSFFGRVFIFSRLVGSFCHLLILRGSEISVSRDFAAL